MPMKQLGAFIKQTLQPLEDQNPFLPSWLQEAIVFLFGCSVADNSELTNRRLRKALFTRGVHYIPFLPWSECPVRALPFKAFYLFI